MSKNYTIKWQEVLCSNCRFAMRDVAIKDVLQFMCDNPVCKYYEHVVTMELSFTREKLVEVKL